MSNAETHRYLYEERKANGLCGRCGKNPISENSMAFCEECFFKLRTLRQENKKRNKEKYKEKTEKRNKEKYKERKANGICTRCGKNPISENSVTFCEECLLKERIEKQGKYTKKPKLHSNKKERTKKCNGDCFNCPYPDCINDYVKPSYTEYNKKYKEEHREEINKKKRELYKERKENGICTRCGKFPIAENSKVSCVECLLKLKKSNEKYRRKKGSLPRELFDGVSLCQKCGKDRPVDGYKLCKSCLEKNRQSIAIGRTMRQNETFRNTMGIFFMDSKK